jgi:hypothetical protein
MSLQVIQERDLLLQLVESLTTHGLLTSNGRIRHSAGRSQATMVGLWRKCWLWDPAQHHKLTSRRCTQRRTVDASGERDGFLQCGTACSAVSPATIRSQACCRQGTAKCPDGANQFGKTVKVFPQGRQIPRRTQMRSCWSSWAWRSRRPWPTIVSSWQRGHSRGKRSSGTTPAQCCLLYLAVR